MRARIVIALALALSACSPPPQVTIDGEQVICDATRIRADRSAVDAFELIVSMEIATTDPEEVERLRQNQQEARERLPEIQERLSACEAATDAR